MENTVLAMVKQTIGLFLLYFQGILLNITSEFPESEVNRTKFQVHGVTFRCQSSPRTI